MSPAAAGADSEIQPTDDHDDLSWIDREAYPFDTHCVELSAGSVHYVDEGPDDPEATLLFCHGNPTWSFLYREPIRELREQYRCVAMDYLGFGLSEHPEGFSYRPQDHAAVLAEFVDELGLEDVVPVVHDWGGPIGLSYALDHPENVRGLVVQNTFAWSTDRAFTNLFSRFWGSTLGRWLCMEYDAFARAVMPLAFGDRSRFPPAVREQYLGPHRDPVSRTGTWVFPQEIRGSAPWLASLWDRREAIADLPALLVWGMEDVAFTDADLRTFQALFAESETVELDDVGHYIAEEAPDRLTEAMADFLADLPE